MKNILVLFLLVNFPVGILIPQDLNIVPKPKEVVLLNDGFSISNSDFSIKISAKDTSNFYIPYNQLREAFKHFKSFEVRGNKSLSRVIWFGIPDDEKEFKNICVENNILREDKIGEEGYSLIIKKDTILVAANTSAGLFYGAQTIKQLIRSNRNNSILPGVKIIDYPSLKLRGILDDISRGPIPTMDYMKLQVRRLAELKMNSLQYYTEHVVKTKKHPAFAPPDGSITIEELKELNDYAKKYHVSLIGNFQSFGHFEKILSHPDYSHLGENGTLLSPAHSESIELLRDIFTEMTPAFDSPFFNVNADETFDLGKGASKQMVDSLGLGVVYVNQVNKMFSILKDLGKRMMIWTDILLQHPETFDMLPEDVIMETWGYDASESYDDMILPVKEKGFEFTISPGVLNSSNTMPDYSISTINIKNFVRDGVKHGSLGLVLTVWDDGGSAFFSRDWYGVAYGADQSWNPNEEEFSNFNQRFNKAIYADETNLFANGIWKLVELTNYSATYGLKEKLLWTKVIPDSGESIRIGVDGWDEVIKIIDSAEILINSADPELYAADIDYFRFTIEQYRYFANLRFNILKAANLYSSAQKKQNSFEAREKILEALNAFSNSRVSLVNLYNDYRNLWLRENHTYAVDFILDKYQNQIDDLEDVEKRIFSALSKLDEGLSIPAPEDIRLGVEKGEGKYFREWMMVNPIPNPEGSTGNSIDYLKAMGGELNAIPRVTQEFEYNNDTYRWRRTASEKFDVVNLFEEFSRVDSNVVTYAFANIATPDERVVEASLGSTDGIDVIINGELVYSVRKDRPLKIDEDTFQLPLKEGKNNLMLKLFQGDGDWKFTFHLPQYKVGNSKNRYKIEE